MAVVVEDEKGEVRLIPQEGDITPPQTEADGVTPARKRPGGKRANIARKARRFEDEALQILVELMRKEKIDSGDAVKKDAALALLQYGHGRPGAREAPKTDTQPAIKVTL